MKHCHPLVDELKGRFKPEHLCELAGLMLLLCLVVAHKQRFFEAGARKRRSRFDCVELAESRAPLRLSLEAPPGRTRNPPHGSFASSPRGPRFASLFSSHSVLTFCVRRIYPIKISGHFTAWQCVRLHFQSSAHTEEIYNYVAEAAQAGELRLLFRLLVLFFCCALCSGAHVSSARPDRH